MNGLTEDVAKSFEKSERKHYTKEMVQRLRLGREMQSATTAAGEEYGNYKKFEGDLNQVKEVNEKGENDFGYDKFQKNVRQMLENVDTGEEST